MRFPRLETFLNVKENYVAGFTMIPWLWEHRSFSQATKHLRNPLDVVGIASKSHSLEKREFEKFNELLASFDNLNPLFHEFSAFNLDLEIDDPRATKPYQQSLLYIGCLLRYNRLFHEANALARIVCKGDNVLLQEIEDRHTSLKMDLLGPLYVKFGGINIDLLQNPNKIPSSQALYYLVSAWQIHSLIHDHFRAKIVDDTVAENTYEFHGNQYPAYAKSAITSAARSVVMFTQVAPSTLIVPKQRDQNDEKPKIYREAIRLIESINRIQQRICNSVLNPHLDQEYEDLITELDTMIQNKDIWQRALRMAGLLDPSRMKEIYRRVIELSKLDRHPDFYSRLADRIHTYVSFSQSDDLPRTLADFAENYDLDGPLPSMNGPIEDSFQAVKAAIITRKPKAGQPYEFNAGEISKLDINWQEIRQPDQIQITIDRNHPQTRFIMNAIWLDGSDEIGDQSILRFAVDLQKQNTDWDFLESPDAEEMQPYRDFLLTVSVAAVNQIKGEYPRNSKTTQVATALSPRSPLSEGEHVHDIVYELKKARNRRKTQRRTIGQSVIQADRPVDSKSVLGEITSSRTQVLKVMAEYNLPRQLVDQFLHEIERYNNGEKRRGKVIQLEGVYRIRSGRYRIVFEEQTKGKYGVVAIFMEKDRSYEIFKRRYF